MKLYCNIFAIELKDFTTAISYSTSKGIHNIRRTIVLTILMDKGTHMDWNHLL